jgi:hypothetical protein
MRRISDEDQAQFNDSAEKPPIHQNLGQRKSLAMRKQSFVGHL